MNNIRVLFVIVWTICNRASARWVTTADFKPSELTNLTQHQEHELMLLKLAKKEAQFLVSSFNYEILSKSIGNSFFQFEPNENTNRENIAIIKAMFECSKNLMIQDRVWRLLWNVSFNGAEYVKTFGSFSLAFSLVCSDIHFSLKNETLYTTLRDEFKKQKYSPPNKIYHYGIAKSIQNEVEAVEELLNEPKMKHLTAHMAWAWIMDSYNSTIKDLKNSIVKLAKTPEKMEQVQKIYEQSVDEIIPLMKRTDILIFAVDAKKLYFDYLQLNLTQRIWNKIVEDIPDWQDYLECDSVTSEESKPSRGQLKKMTSGRCGRTPIGQDLIFNDAWPVTSDLNSFELQNLTLQQQHELFLKKLVTKSFSKIQIFMYLELVAKSADSNFFGFIKDEKSNIRNNAIVKAAFECISNLQLQNRVVATIASEMRKSSVYVARTGGIKESFIQLCSNIDDTMKNETFYTTRRNRYINEKQPLPKKTYQYSFGKPSEDQRTITAELFNDPLVKKFMTHTMWISIYLPKTYKSEEAKTKYSVSELIKIPSKSEAVQRIYEQSVEEIIPFVKNVTNSDIFLNINSPDTPVVVANFKPAEIHHYVSHLTKLIVSKINQNADLVTIFNAIGAHYEMSVIEQTTDDVIIASGRRILK